MAEGGVAACPVAPLAREAAALTLAFRAAEERALALRPGAERCRLERACALIADRREALEDAASQLRAASPEGALFQVMLASAEVGIMACRGGAGSRPEPERRERRVQGCLYGVLRLLEGLAGTSAEALGADHYMPAWFDPHAALAEALAGGRA